MKYPENYINKIICRNCLEAMKDIPDKSIDMVLTSPPYDSLREYGGLDWGEHIWKPIIKELYRIMKDGGTVVWVVGDATTGGTESGTSFRQALYFKETGFNLHDTMIYKKNSSPYPSGKKGVRYTNIFEYMFVFSKGKPKTINLLQDKKNRYAHQSSWGKRKERRKDGELVEVEKVIVKEFGVRNNIWRYNTGAGFTTNEKIAFNHPAVFPEQLARDHIVSWSNKGDIVLDPMCGSGTTCKMAKLNNRNFIGIDISEDYCNIARKRLIKISERLEKFM